MNGHPESQANGVTAMQDSIVTVDYVRGMAHGYSDAAAYWWGRATSGEAQATDTSADYRRGYRESWAACKGGYYPGDDPACA